MDYLFTSGEVSFHSTEKDDGENARFEVISNLELMQKPFQVCSESYFIREVQEVSNIAGLFDNFPVLWVSKKWAQLSPPQHNSSSLPIFQKKSFSVMNALNAKEYENTENACPYLWTTYLRWRR